MKPAIVARQAAPGFQCPLRGHCLAGGRSFGSFRAANRAARLYHACGSEDRRERFAARLYERYVPLVRKTLARFCWVSRCYSGACLPEELVGESYLGFRQALDRFDPAYGVDFVGYLSQRLYWFLEHQVRKLRGRMLAQHEVADQSVGEEEDRALSRVAVADVLAEVTDAEADLLVREAAGYPDRELAEAAGVTPAAMRKRLERLRRRVREGRRRV